MRMSDVDGDIAANFAAITGASLQEAQNWLEIGGFVLEEAVNLYFSSKSNDVGPNQSSSSNGNSRFEADYDQDEVRRPDEVKRRKLLEFDYERINNLARVQPRVSSAFSASNSFVPKNEKEVTLSKIFKAPVELMVNNSFDEVLEMAKEQDKWLVANVQTDSEFQCHTLNRDFWGDETIKDLVMVSALFWQQFDVAHEGSKYVSRYKIAQFPHIAIIDPRTGGIAWRHDGAYDLKLLAEKFQDFLTQQTCPSESRLSTKLRRFATTSSFASHTSSHSSSSNQGGVAGNARFDDFRDGASAGTAGDADEDADMEAAIRMSLEHQEQQQQQSGSEQLSKNEEKTAVKLPGFCVKDLVTSQSGALSEDNNTGSSNSSSSNRSSSSVMVKTAFKLPSGAKISKAFPGETPVQEVASFAAQQLLIYGAADTARFEVFFNFPQQSLSEIEGLSSGKTLTSAGIPNGTAFTVRLLS